MDANTCSKPKATGAQTTNHAKKNTSEVSSKAHAPAEPPVAAELRDLVRRAQEGDAATLPRIKEIMDEHPEVWRHVGDLSTLAEQAWTAVVSADNPLTVESLQRNIKEIKVDLLGDQPTRLMRMIVDEIVIVWMECKYLETVSAEPKNATLKQNNFLLKRLESAQKRFDYAIQRLETVRRLLKASESVPTLKLHDTQEKVA